MTFHTSEADFLLQNMKLNENKVNLFYFLRSIRTGTNSRCPNKL